MKTVFLIIGIIFISAMIFAEGEVEGLNDIQYWENGKIRQCTTYDVEGRLKAKAFCQHDGKVEKIEKYDVYSNKIEEVFYDDKGRLRRGIDGWAARRWSYVDGKVASQISYDEYGKPIDKRYYDESGRLIGRRYVDGDSLNPYEEANMYLILGINNMRYRDARTTD